MILRDLFENDDNAHRAALEQTGFWGSQGAGCIIMAQTTGRILLCHRSRYVQEPHTWGNWGGAIDSHENPKDAAAREVEEETGYTGSIKLLPLNVFEKGSFRYHNFLAVVPNEYEANAHPDHAWESQGHGWFDYGNWPTPLHFGLESLFNDPTALKVIEGILETIPNENAR